MIIITVIFLWAACAHEIQITVILHKFARCLIMLKNNIWSFLTHYSSVFKFSTKSNI